MTSKAQFLHSSGQYDQKPFVDPFVYPSVSFDAESLAKQRAKRLANSSKHNSSSTDLSAKA